MTEAEFYDQFKLTPNHIEPNAPFNGCMFETFGEELKFVQSHVHTNRVWTVTECDGEWVVGAGYHFVNRIGYLITEQPWKSGDEYFLDEM